MSIPVGVRLCNPLNLELGDGSILYVGEVRPSKQPPFREFIDLAHGFRAGVEELRAYQLHHGIETIAQAIERHAPAADGNPTETYAKAVASECGVGVDDPIRFGDYFFPLLDAMSFQECGIRFDVATIDLGISLAN